MSRRGGFAPSIGLALLALVCMPASGSGAAMSDYCQLPPYVNQLTPPNVMILLDSSLSMLHFAYPDGFHTPDNVADDVDCSSSGARCSGYEAPFAANPNYKYYGYFNADRWYRYSAAGRIFEDAGAKYDSSGNLTTKPADGWDGNFLNWLTMRRIDVVRKVMTGGKPDSDKLQGEEAGDASHGIYKESSNTVSARCTPWSGARNYTFLTGPGGPGSVSKFNVKDASNTYGEYDVRVRVPLPVEGVLQTVVREKARLGLAYFNGGEGAEVRVTIGGGSLASTISEINNTRPSTFTPLGEALWEIAGYFANESSIPEVGSPGPQYGGNSDYPTNRSGDPMNYGGGGAGGVPRYPYCARNFVLIITDGEPCMDGNLPTSPVNLKNYAGTVTPADPYNCENDNCYSAPRMIGAVSSPFPSKLIADCGLGGDEAGLEDVALWAHTTDLRSATIGSNSINGVQNLNLYVVSVFGKGSQLLRYAAINGGFDDTNGNNVPDSGSTGQLEWDRDLNGLPDTFNEAGDGQEIEDAVKNALSTMLKRASSGTAASVLASGEGSGANLVQAVFYPRRRMGNDIAWWSGVLKNVWYYIDPFLVGANIREETSADGVLDLRTDYISQFYFDNTTQTTRVKRTRDANGDGSLLSYVDNVAFEDMRSLWEAGELLYARSPDTRTIYSHVDNSNLISFEPANSTLFDPYLNFDPFLNPYLIDYIRGWDFWFDLSIPADGTNDVRSRTVGAAGNVWKLGDIIQSTPRIAGKVPLNTYDQIYGDGTYRAFVTDNAYLNRGMVFAGANDGMFHAFKMGKLETPLRAPVYNPTYQKARLSNLVNPPPLGYESWAFIPKNALPYLYYLSDTDYCHLYYVDLAPYVFDASIGGTAGMEQSAERRTASSWRTVVIGGMRTGGACRDNTAACNSTTDGLPDCVKTPMAGTGLSSYFALDVTVPESPRLLWEFTSPRLGFATSGPAIVRISADNTITGIKDSALNGKWYAVFASGPTGPIDNASTQFLGHSDQNLRIFVLNLKTGALVREIDTTIANAFGGSLINTVADFDLDYQDDAVYIGFTKKDASVTPPTWTKGGVLRLQTKQDANVANWAASRLIDNIGPVTSAPARLQNKYLGLNWVFFGEGRYFYAREAAAGGVDVDDPGRPTGTAGWPGRWLYGLKEPCFAINNLEPTCTTTIDLASDNVVDVTSGAVPSESVMNCVPGALGCANFGWRIGLDNATVSPALANERMITDSLATTSSGLVFFTTFKPYAEACAIGGRSYLWAVRYNTGGAPSAIALKGKALVQVSTASVEEIDLDSAFTDKGGRRSGSIEGVPPIAQGLSILSPPPPIKKILHIQEK